jgi:V-type H+-transporting ATPase subunit a
MFQGPVQVFLLLVAFLCVPWMLLAKPFYELQEHKKTTLAGYVPTNEATSPVDQTTIHVDHGTHDEDGEGHDDHGGHGDVSDLFWLIV